MDHSHFESIYVSVKMWFYSANELKANVVFGKRTYRLLVTNLASELNDKTNLLLSAMDVSDLVSMKNAANCDKQCDLQTSKNH